MPTYEREGNCCCGGGGVDACGCTPLPTSVIVTISGVVNQGACTDCNILNGSFEVDIDPDTCIGSLRMTGPDCFDTPTDPPGNFFIVVQFSGGNYINVKIADGDQPESFHETTFEGECCDLLDTDVPMYLRPFADCDWIAATVGVEAVC